MPRRFGMRILKQEVMYELSREKFVKMIFSKDTKVWESFQERKHHLLYRRKCEILGLCEGCTATHHSIVDCQWMHYYPNLPELVYKRNRVDQCRRKQKRIPNRNSRIVEPGGIIKPYIYKQNAYIEQCVHRLEILVDSHEELHFHENPVMEVYREYTNYSPAFNQSHFNPFSP